MSTFNKNAQLVLTYTVPGLGTLTKALHNVLNYTTPGDSGSDHTFSLLNFLTKWKSECETPLLNCLDFSTILAEYNAFNLDRPTLAPQIQYPALHGNIGMAPGAPAPSLLCAFAYLKTNNRGKGSWGGMHLGGLPLAGIVGNLFTVGQQALLDALLAKLIGPFTDADGNVWKLAILSRKNSSLIPPGPPVNVVMTQVFLSNSAWDDQVKKLTRRSVGLVRA